MQTWITLEAAKDNLQMWVEAQQAVATGQSYKIGTRSLTRASLSDILKMIHYWQNVIDELGAGVGRGARVLRGVPRDF
jgi:hypothetical protein